jgi:amino acid adenylation domain-containing protein
VTARCTVPAVAPDAATLVAAFAAQLARYRGQAAIAVTVTRPDSNWTKELVVAVEGRAFGEVVATVAAEIVDVHADVQVHAAAAEVRLVARGDRLWLDYVPAAISAATVARMADHLATLLANRRDHARVEELPLLAPAEHAWLEAIARGTRRPAATVPAHRLVEGFARTTPAAMAVRHRGDALDYAALDGRANQLAHELVVRGAAGRRVVVCVEPSNDAVVAMLAVWKAGAVYVPLDPSYPRARVAVILAEVAPAVVVTRKGLAEGLGLEGWIDVGARTSTFTSTHSHDPDPDAPAYIFYTSGTTGRPKGVVASHANLAHYAQVARDRYAITAADVIPAIARTSFSISLFELMSPLTAGGTLVVLDREVVLDPARLCDALAGVTLFHAGPSLLKAVLGHVERAGIDPARFDRVRHASSGGDTVPPSVLRGLATTFRAAEVFVIYGCSEIACMGCTYPVSRDAPIERTYVGRAFDNVVARVLDPSGNPVPVGVVGEVWLGGAGVALGYLDRPELTAARFVIRGDDRGYVTGDLGRIAADGNLELVGRSDFQIKVRGMRIELAEVEHHLRGAPSVVDGVVAARDTPGGERALVAYVVLEPSARGQRAAIAAIRRHLTEQLPDYMVPAMYVELAALPLNHNLKLDRNALPPPPASAMLRPAETDAERALVAAFERLLGVEVGVDDNFFERGGDSLTALELVAWVDRELGVRLDGLEVLREPLAVLAASCDSRRGRQVAPPRPARTAPPWRAFHFGHDDELYGVLRGDAAISGTAVLIATPPDQDRVRAGFVLAQLARKLAERGVPSLAFDLYGCWDSLGHSRDATPARWRADYRSAAAELVRRTGATRIVAVAVRLAAPLLCSADVAVARLVLWDPVRDGATWYADASAQHRACVRGLAGVRRGRPPRRRDGVEELCGTTYARATLRELAGLRSMPPAGLAVATHTTAIAWHDATRIDELVPDTGISAALVALVTGAA